MNKVNKGMWRVKENSLSGWFWYMCIVSIRFETLVSKEQVLMSRSISRLEALNGLQCGFCIRCSFGCGQVTCRVNCIQRECCTVSYLVVFPKHVFSIYFSWQKHAFDFCFKVIILIHILVYTSISELSYLW